MFAFGLQAFENILGQRCERREFFGHLVLKCALLNECPKTSIAGADEKNYDKLI